MNEQLKTQVIEQLKSANNVLVAVSSNPTVDELSASIALTLLLNKMNKHATTVFSGIVPSTLEFLQPEKTIETTTDSLRDFIIALDKSKADKLRYKVEDDVVRIFITPYRTSITDKDLEFSQGDFNVDVVIALGVTKREDLDRAITAHGRILHDASVISLTKREAVSELGTMNWQEPQASSLCEMVSVLSFDLAKESIDGQMATALMTGIIAETDRFRNNKTTPLALSLSSQLMSAGANQQLIAEKLEEPKAEPIQAVPPIQMQPVQASEQPTPILPEAPKVDDGALEIDHQNDIDKIHIDEHGNLSPSDEKLDPSSSDEQNPAQASRETATKENPVEEAAQTDNDSQRISDQDAGQLQHIEPVNPEEQKQPAALNDQNTDIQKNSEPTVQDPNPTQSIDDLPESNDSNDSAALPSGNHEVPTMTHGKTIMPPNHSNNSLSDKPFDLQEALKKEIAKEETESGTLPQVSSTDSQVESSQSAAQTESPVPTQPPTPTFTPAPMPQSGAPNAQDQPQVPKDESLLALEKAVDSPHLNAMQDLDSVRDSVAKAADSVTSPFPTRSQSLGAQPVDMQPASPSVANPPKVVDPNAAPPVPPPMPLAPQFYDSDGYSE